MRFLLIILFSISCGHKSEVAPKSASNKPALQALYAAKLAELTSKADADGILSKTDCDLALWNGLAVAGGLNANLDLFEHSPGAIIRNPFNLCTPASRDMVLGYVYGRFSTGDLVSLEQLADYGEANSWYMSSDHELSSIDAVSRGVLGRAIKKLSKDSDIRGYASNPMVCLGPSVLVKDFEQHLQMLEILLDGSAATMPAECLQIAKDYAKANPRDALFAATVALYTGQMDAAAAMLLDPNYVYPSYVRGDVNYPLIHFVFVARIILNAYGN